MYKKISAALGFPILVTSLLVFVSNLWGWTIVGQPVPEGRITGGGSIFTGSPPNDYFVPAGTRITHGFELHCDFSIAPNNLEIDIHLPDGGDSRFHLENLQVAQCWNDPTITPNPPSAPFDSYYGFGVGQYNGQPGYCADWIFTDAGEPGANDRIELLRIWTPCDSGSPQVVLAIFEPGHTLTFGNHQAHTETGK